MGSFTITYKGKKYDIDLNGQIQRELLEKDYKGNLYINISLVREIARVKGWSISEIKTSLTPTGLKDKYGKDLVHTHCEARVYIPDINDDLSKELHGVADDIYTMDGLSRSCFPNMARVQALAVKNALKRAYPFFEADYLQAEDLAERGLIDTNTAKEIVSSVYNQLANKIKSSKAKVDLALIAGEIKKNYDDKNIDGEEFKNLKALYSETYNSLGQ